MGVEGFFTADDILVRMNVDQMITLKKTCVSSVKLFRPMDFVNPFFVSIHIAPNTVAFITPRIITFILFGSMNLFGMFFQLFFRSCFVAINVTGICDKQSVHFHLWHYVFWLDAHQKQLEN